MEPFNVLRWLIHFPYFIQPVGFYWIHKIPTLDPTLSESNPMQTLKPSFIWGLFDIYILIEAYVSQVVPSSWVHKPT